ncbi:hypothetical protein OG21DRAFT_1491738 [Imleria badia]|nr:hypothetical protein OG21DRAFT_1491738 [Imleria badia]
MVESCSVCNTFDEEAGSTYDEEARIAVPAMYIKVNGQNILSAPSQNVSNVTNLDIFVRTVRPFCALAVTNPLLDTPLVFASNGVTVTGFAPLGHVVPVTNKGTSRMIVLLNITPLLKLPESSPQEWEPRFESES